jgi:hypothetical protein
MKQEPISTFDIPAWEGPFDDATSALAQDALENGKVLYFPRLSFLLTNSETALLTDALSDGKAKNISRDPSGRLRGATADTEQTERLSRMMGRFAAQARVLVTGLFPSYADALEQARCSFRPVEIESRVYSPRHDDKRLHVDAFASRPLRGRRILRLFSNINPKGGPRVWHVGEPFEDVARRFAPKARQPWPLEPQLLSALGVTRGRRSRYDYLMLGLHDQAKLSADYQQNAPHTEIPFPAGAAWICFTDQVLHAALKGQYALEQTFHLPVEALCHPERSPLRVLERMTGQALV